MNKLLYISCLVCLFVSTQLFSEQLILHPKQILDVDTGDLYQSQILIEDGMIVKIERDLSIKVTTPASIAPGSSGLDGQMHSVMDSKVLVWVGVKTLYVFWAGVGDAFPKARSRIQTPSVP